MGPGEPMTWYLWVWGGLSTLLLLLAFLVGLGHLLDFLAFRRKRLESISYYQRQNANLQAELERKDETICELLKKKNQFGRITP